jgi:hypothetical protein
LDVPKVYDRLTSVSDYRLPATFWLSEKSAPYVNEAMNQMPICFHRRRLITVFPVGRLPAFPLIKFLPSPPGDQLNRIGNDVSIAIVPDKKIYMVRGHHIVEHTQAEPLLGFEKPLEPSAPVSVKPEKELLLMTPVSNVPDITRYVMLASPRHESSFLAQGFQGQKHYSKVENYPILELFPPEFNYFPWSDPGPGRNGPQRALFICPPNPFVISWHLAR